MSNIPDIERLVAGYQEGTLSAAERAAFEQRLATDPELAALLADYETADAALADAPMRDFMVMLEGVKQQHKAGAIRDTPEAPTRTLIPQRWYAVAATLALLITAGLFVWLRLGPTTPTAAEWYADAYQPYPVEGQRAASAYPFSPALADYQAGRYSQAATALAAYTADTTYGTLATYWQAQALMANAQVAEAIPLWENLLRSPRQTLYTQIAQWYLLLAYLHDGQMDKARIQARQITRQPQHPYQKEAQEFLDQFDS